MTKTKIFPTLYTFGFSLILTTGLGGCDDPPEEPEQRSSKLHQKMMLDKPQQYSEAEVSLPLLSFNIQHNDKSITLSDGDRDKILHIAESLCNIGSTGGTNSSENYKTKVGELSSQLANLGYKIVSLKIIKGDGVLGSQRQEINIRIKNKQSSINCSVDQFKPKVVE